MNGFIRGFKPSHRGMIVLLCHLLIILSLFGKLMYDRATRPRVWTRAVGVDPINIFRGRYITVQLETQVSGIPDMKPRADYNYYDSRPKAKLLARDGKLIAVLSSDDQGEPIFEVNGGKLVWPQPIAFFIPEHAIDPSVRRDGAELWAEVTLPKKGPPRPIRLALKRPDGRIANPKGRAPAWD